MRGHGGLHRVRRRARQPGDQRRSGDDRGHPRPPSGRDQQPDRGDHADREHDPAQPGQERRRATEQHPGPDGGDRGGPGENATAGPGLAGPPRLAAADGHQRGDAGRQRDGVVGVERALHQREHQRGDQRPAAPQEQRGANPVGPRRPTGEPQPGDQQDQGGGQQPGDLAADLAVEQPGEPGLAAEAAHSAATGRHPPGGHPTGGSLGAAGEATGHLRAPARAAVALAAEDPAEPVVAERQLQRAVVRRPADVRAASRPATARRPAATSPRTRRSRRPRRAAAGSGARASSAPPTGRPPPGRGRPGRPGASW